MRGVGSGGMKDKRNRGRESPRERDREGKGGAALKKCGGAQETQGKYDDRPGAIDQVDWTGRFDWAQGFSSTKYTN